jgi:pimeloyl-ACP methyl ester carboxylesterase
MAESVAALPADGAVHLGGHAVHLITQPGLTRPVVLLGGCGVPSYTWDEVVELLADCWVVRLDRPGLVRTPWPRTLPELSTEVATLADLGAQLGEPMVLVAHSMAGLHAEALARQHPELVAALILVDGSVTWSPKRPPSDTAWLRVARGVRRAMRVAPLRPLGSLADRVVVATQSNRRLSDQLPPVVQAIFRDPDAVASVVAEQAAYAKQVWALAVLRESTTWPAPPAVVLTAAGDGGPSWVTDQARLARLLTARHVVLTDSRHLMMLDRPDAVANAVRAVLDEDGQHD